MLLASSRRPRRSGSRRNQSVDVGYGLTGRRPVPLQHLRPARLLRRGLPPHPVQAPLDRRAEPPRGPRELRPPPEGPRPDHRARRARASRRRSPASCARSSRSGPVHIVTIEDPIEFLFADGKAAVSQREVSTDSPSFNEPSRTCSGRTPTSSWSARCATGPRCRRPSRPPRRATSSSRPCTRTAPPSRSTASSTPARRSSRPRSARSSRSCCRPSSR